ASALLFLSLPGTSEWLSAQQPPAAGPHSAVRILSPREGELLTINIVHCKYEMVELASADSSPTFQVQLDDRGPMRTVMTDHTFTGLKEGPHVIFIVILDANDTPIPGTRALVHFKVPPPRSSSSGGAAPQPALPQVAATTEARPGQSSFQTIALAKDPPPKEELLESSSPLPLLAVLCEGALAGGTISVLRTRGRRKPN